jgi:capsid assembly protease
MDFDLKYWAGTDESLGVYLLCLKKMIDNGDFRAGGEAYTYDSSQPEKDDAAPRLFSRAGDIGIIKIAGPLVNNDSVLNRYYGITGYGEIRDALVYAAKQGDIGAIVLDVASGGGSVAGVFDTANLIRTIDTKVKPVHAFSGGGVMSAAYLLASSARSVNIDQMTEAGSVGVIAVHQEMSKMLKEIGITPTVMRAGKYKALGNPYEPLTEQAKAEMQAQLDQLYEIFVKHVADMRGVSYAVADEKMAQGRVFIGQRAKDVGLVDAITNFDSLMSKVQGGIDSAKERSKYGANSTNQNNKGIVVSKQALTEQSIAALAEGAGLAVEAGGEHGGGSGGAPAAEQKPETQVEQKPAVEAAEQKPETQVEQKPAEPSALQVVQTQLAESQAKVLDLSVELRDAKVSNESMKATHASMRAIAVASVERLKVALGQTPGGSEALADEALLAQHDSLRKVFEEKFKAGGVAAVTPADASESQGTVAAVDPARKARIAATRLK